MAWTNRFRRGSWWGLALAWGAGGGPAYAQAPDDSPPSPPRTPPAGDVAAEEPPSGEPAEKEAPPAPESVAEEPPAGDPAEEEAPAAADDAQESTESSPARQITLPEAVELVPARLPAGTKSAPSEVAVVVELDAQGALVQLSLPEGLGPELESALERAVRASTFRPARRGERAIAARAAVRVPVVVESPDASPEAAPEEPGSAASESSPSESSPSDHPHSHSSDHMGHAHEESDSHLQVTVHGQRPLRTHRRSASDFFVHREVLDAAPHSEGADALMSVPGLTIARTEGLAVAHSYNLRGFDAAHGQDIEFSVGGLPINQPSHIHGQGYADLGFLVGEVVDELWVNEGISDPAQGDFAVAGSVRVGLGVDERHRGLQLRTSGGSFGTLRQVAVWAPKGDPRENLGAVQFQSTEGFGQQRAARSASAIVQHQFGEDSPELDYRFIAFGHTARGEHAGFVRADDVESGELCFHCTYDSPSSRAQGALAARLMAGLFADYRGENHASGTVGAWLGYDRFQSKSNPTGYLRRSRTLEGVWGRGDLIDQSNRQISLGLEGRYRTEAFDWGSWVHGTVEVGAEARVDDIAQGQTLVDASVRNQIWDELIDAEITGTQIAGFFDLDVQLGKSWDVRAGARAALLSFDVRDRLANFSPASRPEDASLDGYGRSAAGLFAGPRLSTEWRTTDAIALLGSYGEGYRSPQATTLEDGQRAPFTRVRSGDAGVRFRWSPRWTTTTAGYVTHLSDDAVFDPSEGSLERVGRSLRAGATFRTMLRPNDGLLAVLSATYVHATLQEPPPASAENPSPPFEKGQRLPYVPPLVVRLEGSGQRELLKSMGGHALTGDLGLGFTYRSPRPLPYSQWGQDWLLLDASLGLRWGALELDVQGMNLLNRDVRAEEYVYTSHFDRTGPTTRVPVTHFAAGAPRSFFATLGVTL